MLIGYLKDTGHGNFVDCAFNLYQEMKIWKHLKSTGKIDIQLYLINYLVE